MSVLGNYVAFVEGQPKTLRVESWAFVDRSIVDPETKQEKTMRQLQLQVFDAAEPTRRVQWSITSEKLAQQLFPLLQSGAYKSKQFVVTVHGQGKRREYAVEVK